MWRAGERFMVNKLLVTGGIRSGKAGLAEQSAKPPGNDVVYVATATAGDDEMALRIQRHQQLRPDHWPLVEEPLRLGRVLSVYASGPGEPPLLLVDCMSLWLSNLLFADGSLFQPERAAFLEAVEAYPGPLVIRSEEHTSELQSRPHLVCRLLLEKKNNNNY